MYTNDVKNAWNEVYGVVTKTMCSDFYENEDILIDEITDHKIKIVKESWQKVMELGEETVGRIIFKNLFEADGELLSLFSFSSIEEFEDSE